MFVCYYTRNEVTELFVLNFPNRKKKDKLLMRNTLGYSAEQYEG